jgi:hypothetical protein
MMHFTIMWSKRPDAVQPHSEARGCKGAEDSPRGRSDPNLAQLSHDVGGNLIILYKYIKPPSAHSPFARPSPLHLPSAPRAKVYRFQSGEQLNMFMRSSLRLNVAPKLSVRVLIHWPARNVHYVRMPQTLETN